MTDQTSFESWLIVGAGAIGLLWACKLQQSGLNVTVLTKDIEGMKNIGLIQKTQLHEHQIRHASIEKIPLGHSHVLICTKAFDQLNAYKQIKHHISPSACIITLCNGMGIQQKLQACLIKNHKLIAGSTTEGALKHSQYSIEQTGTGTSTFGFFDNQNHSFSKFPKAIAEYKDNNIAAKILMKAVINAVINPITAINSIQNGALLTEPYYSQSIKTIEELVTLLKNSNFQNNNTFFKGNRVEIESIKDTVFDVARKTSANRSSMLEDISNKRRTEIEFISGYFINEGKKIGMKLPIQESYFEKIAYSI